MSLRKITLCLLPLLFGGLIYVFFRPVNLLMFNWFETIGISDKIYDIRNSYYIQNTHLPNWIKYSLPDALWLFSMTSLILVVWNFRLENNSIIWLSFVIFTGICSELGQLLHLIPGTFDIIDFLLLIIASLFPFILNKNKINIKTINS